ncbi:hypothetical protein OSCT_2141 [Oscillochloris trichoides DG-6]|uniref:Uncharacterized protein n=1 Tax=Oscillochloris trichoides DG-6 TaxID=765420 RepID=E1IFP0_9CHLR|nr:hypothetical protein OSCT_2141 [Oscillochloris trichoides DG-6]
MAQLSRQDQVAVPALRLLLVSLDQIGEERIQHRRGHQSRTEEDRLAPAVIGAMIHHHTHGIFAVQRDVPPCTMLLKRQVGKDVAVTPVRGEQAATLLDIVEPPQRRIAGCRHLRVLEEVYQIPIEITAIKSPAPILGTPRQMRLVGELVEQRLKARAIPIGQPNRLRQTHTLAHHIPLTEQQIEDTFVELRAVAGQFALVEEHQRHQGEQQRRLGHLGQFGASDNRIDQRRTQALGLLGHNLLPYHQLGIPRGHKVAHLAQRKGIERRHRPAQAGTQLIIKGAHAAGKHDLHLRVQQREGPHHLKRLRAVGAHPRHSLQRHLIQAIAEQQRTALIKRRTEQIIHLRHTAGVYHRAQRRKDGRLLRSGAGNHTRQSPQRQNDRQAGLRLFPAMQRRHCIHLIQTAQRQRPGQMAQEGTLPTTRITQQNQMLLLKQRLAG